ncbi:MAG: radical SAM protein, partial [FCB group bacterium]|nr:radical SAM protein [FCB group bacterium]
MKIIEIDIESPLFGQVAVGAELVKVNGREIADDIDFQFFNTEETVELEIIDGGKLKKFSIDRFTCDLGLVFEQTKIKICKNDCIFCFIHQQPKGMRRALYIKDDDYRYSFTHGNFITLSEMSDADF